MSPGSPEEAPAKMFQYRILRYMPNLLRDEWVNIGVLLEDTSGARQAMRLIEETGEFARVRRVHPDADEDFLHALAPEFDARLRGPAAEVAVYLQKLEQNLSNVLQLAPAKALLADNFDVELERLYREQVTPPTRRAGGLLQNTRDWMRDKLNDVFRRHRILGQAGTSRARRRFYAAGRSHAARLWLPERRARVHPVGFLAARFAAGESPGLYGGLHPRARSPGGNHGHHRHGAGR